MPKKAIISGVTGQDGAYLAAFLLSQGYVVYGTHRRVSSPNFWRLETLNICGDANLHLVELDVTDSCAVAQLVYDVCPDEIYNLAAQSFVPTSFKQPMATTHVNAFGVLNFLEAVRLHCPKARFYQASTSEMFGNTKHIPQNEQTPFCPQSPYATSKLYAHWLTINYRNSYNIFASSGILFNHESPLRGLEFVTRKITDSVAKIVAGKSECLCLGNLYAKRDWGYAKEYVVGMWQMLQYERAETFVLATQKSHTIKDFATMCFEYANMPICWEKHGNSEIARDCRGIVRIQTDSQYHRLADVDYLLGDCHKARDLLGWQAQCSLQELCALMLDADLQRNR